MDFWVYSSNFAENLHSKSVRMNISVDSVRNNSVVILKRTRNRKCKELIFGSVFVFHHISVGSGKSQAKA